MSKLFGESSSSQNLSHAVVDYLQETRDLAERYRLKPCVQPNSLWRDMLSMDDEWPWARLLVMWWAGVGNSWPSVNESTTVWQHLYLRLLASIKILVLSLYYFYGAVGGLEAMMASLVFWGFSELVWKPSFGRLIWIMAFRQNGLAYLPLNPLNREIRLLRIRPGSISESIQCDLISGDWKCSQYEALSYAWGRNYPYHHIHVNGRAFWVTGTLHDALRSLRCPNTTRTFWIDAICINQNDLKEKSEQVQKMRQLYENARHVVVWLGDLPYDPKYAEMLVDELQRTEALILGWRGFSRLDYYAKETFRELVTRSWWNRAWVVQEVVAARDITVQFGQCAVSWDDFCKRINRPPPFLEIPRSVTEFVERVSRLRANKNQPEWDLLRLAYDFRYQEASEALDKLYAFLEFTNDPRAMSVRPDYSKAAFEAFRNFTKGYIEHYQSLRVLSMVTGNNVENPSWCPNFGRNGNRWRYNGGIITDPFQDNFSAAGGRPASPLDHPDPFVLGLQGFEYDTVVAVGQRGPMGSQSDYGPTWEAWKRLAEIEDSHPIASVAFDDTIHAGQNIRIQERFDSKYSFSMSFNRRFFITAKGAYGVGPAQTRPGDRVCVLFGGDIPFLLRMSKRSRWRPVSRWPNNFSRIYHKIIGLSYVHGIMNYIGDINSDVASKRVIVDDFYLV